MTGICISLMIFREKAVGVSFYESLTCPTLELSYDEYGRFPPLKDNEVSV